MDKEDKIIDLMIDVIRNKINSLQVICESEGLNFITSQKIIKVYNILIEEE